MRNGAGNMNRIDECNCDILIKKLHKSFHDNHVLRGLDLCVYQGETLAIIGGSGCGKSVLLKHISGLMQPDSGAVEVFGEDMSTLKGKALAAHRRRVGVVFQGAALLNSLTVSENVGLGLEEAGGKTADEIRDIVAEKLEMVSMEGTEDMMPEELSGGMKKRVGVARTLAMNPDIILYDEPTAGLDPIICEDVDQLMLDMKERVKITAILVTHDLISAFRVADRMAMMHEGVLVESGTPDELMKSENDIVNNFTARHAGLVRRH